MKKKLIEVALPLKAINAESAREKSIRHGHPSTLHLWWARRPLATCRAVLFASLVDDPASHPDKFPTPEDQAKERERLFQLIERLVKWESANDPKVLEEAYAEILKSTGGNPPAVYDPFCGGGAIPIEAQRLGLTAYGSDLNPVAVLVTKALVEIPPRFAGRAPVNPESRRLMQTEWHNCTGLADDVRYYGTLLRNRAEAQIGHLFPKARLKDGTEVTVIAWLWANTIPCPNPACGATMPLLNSLWLSKVSGRQAWLEPVVQGNTVRFEVKTGKGTPPDPPKMARGANFRCLVCGTIANEGQVRQAFQQKQSGVQMVAMVAEGAKGRLYLPADEEHARIAHQAQPKWKPEEPMNTQTSTLVSGRGYGIEYWYELFTPRQLLVLTTLCDLLPSIRKQVLDDALSAGMPDDGRGLEAGGKGATAYADAVTTYLAFVIDRMADYNSVIVSWVAPRETLRNTFARQAIPMVWDFAEVNPFSDSTGNLMGAVEWVYKVLANHPVRAEGAVWQADAREAIQSLNQPVMISTDPPYYDNIDYSNLADFFYVWLRRTVGEVYPSLFRTALSPKENELVASIYRFGRNPEKARDYFESGLRQVFASARQKHHPDYPMTVYYAYKQTEREGDEETGGNGSAQVASTGWETMLSAVIHSGFSITGTIPLRTEMGNRPRAIGSNALASSIVLVCRPRPEDAPRIGRREFLEALRQELPPALKTLQQSNIAPVDLAQSAIGPGIAVFSRYSAVLEPDGKPMSVRTALQIINKMLDEFLSEQDADYDADTRWAIAWFEQYGFNPGAYGDAETLSKARNTSVEGLVAGGIAEARGGKVRLLTREELPDDWDPAQDERTSVWEMVQHLAKRFEKEGEQGASALMARLMAVGKPLEVARELGYRLYQTCERWLPPLPDLRAQELGAGGVGV